MGSRLWQSLFPSIHPGEQLVSSHKGEQEGVLHPTLTQWCGFSGGSEQAHGRQAVPEGLQWGMPLHGAFG